jgi:disulfide bond formation protein DsbB
MLAQILTRLTPRMLVLLAAASSGALLLGALGFQAMGYAPCALCMQQRWPHLAALVIGGLIALRWLPLVPGALAGALAALATSGLGFYHSGVEKGIFEGPDTCTSNGVDGLSVEALIAQIEGAPLVRCDEISWQIFGLTMANLNALASLGLAAVWLWAALRARAA